MQSLLMALSNLKPDQATTNFVRGWTTVEWGNPSAETCAYNLLNTEQAMPGSSSCQSGCSGSCVQAFASYPDGITANAQVITGGGYPNLFMALANNDDQALYNASGALVLELGQWAGHSGNAGASADYYNAIVQAALGADNSSDQFPGASSGVSILGGGGNPLSGLASIGQFFSSLMAINPIQVAKAVLGIILIIAGIFLMIKQLTPPEVKQVVGAAAKVAAA